jgi:hypothetical protein
MPKRKNPLRLINKGVTSALEHASSEELRAIALQSCRIALGKSGLESPLISEALNALESGLLDNAYLREKVNGLVEELDNEAWDLQDAWEEGSAKREEYLLAFAKARSANAVYFALHSSPNIAAAETLYETYYATDNLEELKSIVEQILDKAIE